MFRFLIFLISIFFFQASFSEGLSVFKSFVSSPDGKLIAIVKPTKKIIPDSCSINDNSDSINTLNNVHNYAKQIWIYDVKSKKSHILVRANFSCNDPETQILDPQKLKFSPDGKKLYFLVTGWVTSAALHVVDIDGQDEHYLMPANNYSIIPRGQFKGYLVASQHRYFAAGGSYNGHWLYSPSGKEIRSLGKELKY